MKLRLPPDVADDLVAALAWTALAFLPALAWQAISEASRGLANNRR